jgi:hypothetical protein
MLTSFIVFLSLRMRLSRQNTQEFLNDWLGVYVTVYPPRHAPMHSRA